MDEFDEICRRCTPVVYRFLLSLCKDASLADELTADDIFELLADKEQAMRIHASLHRLKEPYREVFTLRVLGELHFRDIADLFGKSESWAKVTFYRAKDKLIEDMEEHHEH